MTTDENVAKIKVMVKDDPRLTITQMVEILKISRERVHNIMHCILGARHICVQFIPHFLTTDQINTGLDMFLIINKK